jgi:general secretion pathway protein K
LALVAVLWIVALLSLLAVTALAVTRARMRETAHRIEQDRAAALREAALLVTIRDLSSHDPARHPRVDGQAFAQPVLGDSVQVTIEDESGRVDLNRADDDLLLALLIGNGTRQSDAEDFVARLRDWQDADDIRRPGGAEAGDYRGAGLPYGPRNAPLQSVDEVFQLLTVKTVPLECFLSAFTVYTGRSNVNPRTAGALVRQGLAWADRIEWRGRRWLADGATSEPPSYAGQVLRLEMAVATSSGGRPSQEIVLRMTGDERLPYLLIRDEPRTSPTAASDRCTTILKPSQDP